MSEDAEEYVYGGFATSSDPVVFWYTEEGSKRGKRNLMWDICMDLREEYEAIRAQRIKLRSQLTSMGV